MVSNNVGGMSEWLYSKSDLYLLNFVDDIEGYDTSLL